MLYPNEVTPPPPPAPISGNTTTTMPPEFNPYVSPSPVPKMSVTQRLRYHIQAGQRNDVKEFQICCISLAKDIDFAIANNEIPKKVEVFPLLLKQMRNSFGSFGNTSPAIKSPGGTFSQIIERQWFVTANHHLMVGWVVEMNVSIECLTLNVFKVHARLVICAQINIFKNGSMLSLRDSNLVRRVMG